MDKFQAILPSMLLAPYVKQYWFLTSDTQGFQRAIPSGSIGLVFNRADRIYSSAEKDYQPRSHIFGQSNTYVDLNFGMLDLIIVVFQPLGAKAFFRMPMNELNGLNVGIDLLSDSKIIELESRLMGAVGNQTCVRLIEEFLTKRICKFEEHNFKRLSLVLQSMNIGESNVSKLAQMACLSQKQFNRIFADFAGLNPKNYLQINRFAKTAHTLQTKPQMNLNELAETAGYYDKSHLIKEFKTLSGYTPAEFLSNSDPYSDYMSLFQTFFIHTKHELNQM